MADPKPNPRILYHGTDLDGRGSAAIAFRALFPEARSNPEILAAIAREVCIPCDYNQPLPDLPKDCAVHLLDFSFPTEDMARLVEQHPVTYIDHHAPKIAELRQAGILDQCQAFAVNEDSAPLSAIFLAWEHYFPRQEIPRAITLLSAYDARPDPERSGTMWDAEILPFQHGFRSVPTDPWDTAWNEVLWSTPAATTSALLRYIADGNAILRSRDQTAALFGPRSCYLTRFRGLTALFCNGGSETYFCHHPDYQQAQLLITYRYEPRNNPAKPWKCTIWPGPADPSLDVGAWATTNLDGGGHRGCAGFSLASPPIPAQAAAHVLSVDDPLLLVALETMYDAQIERLAEKLAEGKCGWEDEDTCFVDDLVNGGIFAMEDGQYIDAANYATMLHYRTTHGTA